MGRDPISPPQIDENGDGSSGGGGSDVGFHSIRDRFPIKRNPVHHHRNRSRASTDRALFQRGRSHHSRFNRKGFWWFFPFRGKSSIYVMIIFVVFLFSLASMVLQSSITSVFRPGGESEKLLRQRRLTFGTSLRFVPGRVSQRFLLGDGIDRLRTQARVAVRAPRLALILGNMKKDPQSLMLVTVITNLQKLGYVFEIFSVGSGKALTVWEKVGGHVSVLGPHQKGQIEWSIFEGVIVDSIEAEEAIRSIMQEPFCSVPLIWIIQEDDLAVRLQVYEDMGWESLIAYWRSAFSRADVVVFPDFSLPMLYSLLDTGNFFVIAGSPIDFWVAERYSNIHSKNQLRKASGLTGDDLLVIVVGSSFYYDDLSWDYAVAMRVIGPLLTKYARRKEAGESFKFLFLCGNSTDGYDDALQEVASRLGLPDGSVRHRGINGDVNSLLSMADIVLYGSVQDVQGFPPLLIRAMTFGIPIVAPDFPVLRKYVVDGVHGLFFPKNNPDALLNVFSLLISNGKLSKFALAVASSGRLLARDMMALDCISGYARLLENVLNFPSDVFLPGPVSLLQKKAWAWNLLRIEVDLDMDKIPKVEEESYWRQSSIIYALEAEFKGLNVPKSDSQNETDSVILDAPSETDWNILGEFERSEENERLERRELDERMDKDIGIWDEIYRNARKIEKLTFEANERDEGELERTGLPVCIYEIYAGAGAWPFLHHGSLYRGLSLSRRSQRLQSDDVDAVGRLPFLNDTYYRDLLCEMGGMFSIANKIDNIHMRPWIGFQSWHAAGRKTSLSVEVEKLLKQKIRENVRGDVMYFWARLDMDGGVAGNNNVLTFWSMCDILNGGKCRTAFENAFRRMYSLPPNVEALPPMPEDGGHWSALHSWVMPTPSFLEFIMFSRMFTDSLDALHANSTKSISCSLGSSETEKKHCYCRVLELLVNVWAYHSARKMVYINPHSGHMEEAHPLELRRGFMWAKYFDFTLLKSMDEDLAEAADDGDHSREMWLWPLTGEVHWRGVYDREREERYRFKMDKKRKAREKLYDRMKHGYRQKSLGR